MESVDGAGAVRVGHQLVDVAPPGLLGIVAHGGLEGCQDGGEEGRRRRRGAALQEVVPLLLGQAGQVQRSGQGGSGESREAGKRVAGGRAANLGTQPSMLLSSPPPAA